MFLFIMWMTGSSLSIYTIMFTMSFATKPFTSIMQVQKAFKPYKHENLSLLLPKLIYIASNCAVCALAIYKFSNMGIVPVQPADWAGLLSPKNALESNAVLVLE